MPQSMNYRQNDDRLMTFQTPEGSVENKTNAVFGENKWFLSRMNKNKSFITFTKSLLF